MWELILQSTPVLSAGILHCQSTPFIRSQALKTAERTILRGFSIKFHTGTTLSRYYGCSLANANWQLLNCFTRAFTLYYTSKFKILQWCTGLLKIMPKPVNVYFHPGISCVAQCFSHWLNWTAKIFSLSQHRTFIVAKTKIWVCFMVVKRVHGWDQQLLNVKHLHG